jgi:hypothetical protein
MTEIQHLLRLRGLCGKAQRLITAGELAEAKAVLCAVTAELNAALGGGEVVDVPEARPSLPAGDEDLPRDIRAYDPARERSQRALALLRPGNRFRLMFGQPLLPGDPGVPEFRKLCGEVGR